MILLNMKVQIDTPEGVVHIHVFVVNQENGKFLVYCRRGNDETSREVPTLPMALDCVKNIIDRVGHI